MIFHFGVQISRRGYIFWGINFLEGYIFWGRNFLKGYKFPGGIQIFGKDIYLGGIIASYKFPAGERI